MQEILDIITKMRQSRGWDKTDSLPILIKSVSVEASELLETIQWDEQNYKLDDVKSELADVLMYALAIAIDQNWDVKELITNKVEDVYRRYPEKEND